jgi:hypothetical protein
MCFKKGDSFCWCATLIPVLILVLVFWDPAWARTGIIILAILGVIKAFTPCCCQKSCKTKGEEGEQQQLQG